MKKLLVALVVVGMVGALGAIGYQMFRLYQIQQLGQSVQVSQETTAPSRVVKEVQTRADVTDKLEAAQKKNPDVVAWLQIPNTSINSPVLQSMNNYYYLRLNEERKSDIYGCYFADFTCSIGDRNTISQNTIVYGHSDLKDNPEGPRFSQLFRYANPDFAVKNPYIYLSTLEEPLAYEVFAVLYTDTKMDYIQPRYAPADFAALVQEAQSKSLYNYDEVSVGAGDKILTLSTCSKKYGEREDIRFVVMARLVQGEAEKQEAALSPNLPVEPK